METPVLKPPFARSSDWGFAAVAAAALAIVLVACVHVWLPGYGLTRFIPIGRVFNDKGTAVYQATPKYMDPYPPNRWGFDGQLYAEISLDPLLRDPQLKVALDNPTYRSQRVLLSALAWVGGLGHPFWILNAYAALNPIFWLGYAVILVVLFRPYGWAGVAGFAAMLLTCGVSESITRALTDFPAFVLLTLAAMVGGLWGAGLLGLCGLTREADILGIFGLTEWGRPWGRTLGKNLLLGVIAAGPMLLWFLYVGWRFLGHAPVAAAGGVAAHLPGLVERTRAQLAAMTGGNLDWPLHGMALRFGDAVTDIRRDGIDLMQLLKRGTDLHAILTVVATLTQCLYVLTNPVWKNRLWRIGAVFVPYFLCVSYNVWWTEAYFTVTRHALPITLAFNLVLAMRPTRRWLLWFVLGNCFVPAGINDLVHFASQVPQHAEYVVEGVPPLDANVAAAVTAAYGTGWSGPEWTARKAWRWSAGREATLILDNPGPQALKAELRFDTLSIVARDLRVSARGAAIQLRLDQRPRSVPVSLGFVLPPGRTTVELSSPQPASRTSDDPRPLGFMAADLSLSLSELPPK